MTVNQNKAVLVFSWIIILSYGLVAIFIHPYADDFTYALKGQSADLIQTVLNERYTWNGRYISNFILIYHPLNWGGIYGYKIMAVILLLLSWFGLYVSFRIVQIKKTLVLSSVVFVIILSSIPNITEAFYWVCGAWTYLPASILLFLVFTHLYKNNFTPSNLHSILILVALFIGSGLNELFALVSLAMFFLNFKINWRVIGLIFIQLLLFYYVLSAPGNHIRSGLFSNNHQVFNSINLTIQYTIRFIGEWLLNPTLYLFVLLLIQDDKIELKLPLLKKWKNIVGLTLLPISLACFGPIWSTGILGQHRTANFACYLFFGFLFFILLVNKNKIRSIISFNSKFVFPLFLICLLTWKNNYNLFKELSSGELKRMDEQLTKREKILTNCKLDSCFVPVIMEMTSTFEIYPLLQDPNHWKNKCYQLYFQSGLVLPDKHR
jgi:hypothetical protein